MTLAMHNICFSWDKKSSPLLNFHEFQASAGEKILIRGPSGSGKSTILNLIGGVLLPQTGSISILDTELTQCSASQRDRFRADHMGFIFQMFNLIPYLSIMENIVLPLKFSAHKRAKLKQRGLIPQQEAERLLAALGLDPKSNKKVRELSVGQQQRVAVARALMGSPELIIADEPSSALDYESRTSFLELLFKECEREKTTLLYVSHDPNLEVFFDRTIPISEFRQDIAGERAHSCQH